VQQKGNLLGVWGKSPQCRGHRSILHWEDTGENGFVIPAFSKEPIKAWETYPRASFQLLEGKGQRRDTENQKHPRKEPWSVLCLPVNSWDLWIDRNLSPAPIGFLPYTKTNIFLSTQCFHYVNIFLTYT
jgi:hypothetical protein